LKTKEAFDGMLQSDIDQMNACMKCASTLKNCAKMKKYTVYGSKLKNKTHWMGNQTMAVQYDCMHEAMAKVRLFKNLDDTYIKDIDDDGYSPSLLCAQVKRDFDDSYLPALLELQKWISNIQHANITMEQSDVLLWKIFSGLVRGTLCKKLNNCIFKFLNDYDSLNK
jgi:hypothetical protein